MRAPGGLLIWVLAAGARDRERLLGAAFFFLFFLTILRLSEIAGLGLLELDVLPLVAASAGEREWERLRENFSLGKVCSLRFDGRRPRGPGDRERKTEAR
jgi:hypothetical protein